MNQNEPASVAPLFELLPQVIELSAPKAAALTDLDTARRAAARRGEGLGRQAETRAVVPLTVRGHIVRACGHEVTVLSESVALVAGASAAQPSALAETQRLALAGWANVGSPAFQSGGMHASKRASVLTVGFQVSLTACRTVFSSTWASAAMVAFGKSLEMIHARTRSRTALTSVFLIAGG